MPDFRVIDTGFEDFEFETDNDPANPDISEDVQQTLARIILWDDAGQRWRAAECDNIGRLVVSPAGTSYDTITETWPAINTTAQQIVEPNPVRRWIRITNREYTEVRYGFSSAMSPSGYLILLDGESRELVGYTGPIFIWVQTGTATVKIEEA